jgi:sugar diacid utilization regulator
MSAEDRLTKLTEEQLVHLNSLKDKLEKIDSLTSKQFGH